MTQRILSPLNVSAFLLLSLTTNIASAQLTLLNDLVLDNNALLMPSNATYGRAINGVAFQAEPLLSHGGYQYATWYHNGVDEDVYVARRALTGSTWEIFDTGSNLDNGDATAWDAHNVISLGISGDDRIHFAWDLHGHPLRFRDSDPGDATGAFWDASLFNSERNSLNAGGAALTTLTYPQFTTDPATGNMFITYRTGGSGAGNQYIATYDAATGTWNAPHEFINGTNSIFYDDPFGSGSNNRNAYLNGLDIDSTGRLHTTFTWRETATGSSNHDIMYAYSDDGGDTWHNNAGAVVATPGNPMNLNSSGIVIVPMDRGNTLMNQQAQTVDLDNRVHIVMWHKREGAAPVTGFTTTPADYFHYFRDPTTGVWTRTELPTHRAVGSRPDIAHDENGNLYVVYVSPGPGDAGGYYTNGDLIVATASKATGYDDWEIVYTDTRDFAGEPFLDQRRLVDDGILSVGIQENSPITTRTGSPLHVLEFQKLANKTVWVGDDTGNWLVGSGTDWDNDNNNIGEDKFENGYRVTFDDEAAQFSVNIAAPVAPSSIQFTTNEHDYVFTGAGITGFADLRLTSSRSVTLANAANTYSGGTQIESGTLILTGGATISSSNDIVVAENGTLDVSGLSAGYLPLENQYLTVKGPVQGNIVASGSFISGTATIGGDLQSFGSTIQVGDAGMPVMNATTTIVVDEFSDADLSEYTSTVVNDGSVATANVMFSSPSGELAANYTGFSAVEQVMFVRDDVNLEIGDTLVADLDMNFTPQEMDLGLAISATAAPTPSTGGDTDTRDTFDWASVSMRPSQNNIRVNQSIDGSVNTTTGTLSGVSEGSVAGLYIQRISATQFTVGYFNNDQNYIEATTVNFTSGGVGTALGFYADLRSAGSLGNFDNLRILRAEESPYGQTLTIEGDVVLDALSILQIDISEPGVGDLLAVGGNFHAGGTLSVSLDPVAPQPSVGDVFDVLDFATASGRFDGYELPELSSGLAWNVSDLTTSGELRVVTDVDMDDDGDVDGRDFLAIQRTNPSLIPAWQEQYGDLIAVPGAPAALVVPEPRTEYLLFVGLCWLAFRWM